MGSKHGAERALFYRLDVSSTTNFDAAFAFCIEKFGQIDVLVNNAAVASELFWETMTRVNFMVRKKKLAPLGILNHVV